MTTTEIFADLARSVGSDRLRMALTERLLTPGKLTIEQVYMLRQARERAPEPVRAIVVAVLRHADQNDGLFLSVLEHDLQAKPASIMIDDLGRESQRSLNTRIEAMLSTRETRREFAEQIRADALDETMRWERSHRGPVDRQGPSDQERFIHDLEIGS